jgi:hypothetical protein
MDTELLNSLFKLLQSQTLAHMLVDLEEAEEEWQHYPAQAPSEEIAKKLRQARLLIAEAGAARARAEGLDFQQTLEQARDRRDADAEDWLLTRNRQTRENWYKDYE